MKFFLLVALAIVFSGCLRKECRDIPGGYTFQVQAILQPTVDTIRIGDTMSLASCFSNRIFEEKTQEYFILENFEFFPSVAVYKIDEMPASEDGLADFEILISDQYNFSYQKFSSGASGLFGEYTYNEQDNEYSLKFQLVAASKGLYYLEYGISPDLKSQNFPGKCNNIGISSGTVLLNQGQDNNISLLKDSPDPHYNNWILQDPTDRFYKFGGYCFYVVE
jgi:hypothetical protein